MQALFRGRMSIEDRICVELSVVLGGGKGCLRRANVDAKDASVRCFFLFSPLPFTICIPWDGMDFEQSRRELWAIKASSIRMPAAAVGK